MKVQKRFCTEKVFLRGAVIVATGLLSVVCSSQAQIVTLTDGDSVAQVNTANQAGMFYWAVQGHNQLQQQWFWYGVGAGPVKSIDMISAPAVVTTGSRELTTTYVNPGNYSVAIDYLLTGGSSTAPYVSDIGETIKIVNLSGAVLPYHFYQYSYFNLNGAGKDTVQLGQNGRGLYNDALQMNDSIALSETVTTPGANRGEVAALGTTLNELNSSPAGLNLSDAAGPFPAIGSTNVTWALQWDLNIAPGGSAIISKDKYLSIVLVPEPSALALIGLGALGFSLWRRRRLA